MEYLVLVVSDGPVQPKELQASEPCTSLSVSATVASLRVWIWGLKAIINRKFGLLKGHGNHKRQFVGF